MQIRVYDDEADTNYLLDTGPTGGEIYEHAGGLSIRNAEGAEIRNLPRGNFSRAFVTADGHHVTRYCGTAEAPK